MNNSNLIMPNEKAVVRQARDDPAAFAHLYDHYWRRVYNFMCYRLNDEQRADDLTAQVFHRALTSLERYDPQQAPFGAWLFGIAHHVIRDHFRRQKRWQWLSLDALRQRFTTAPQPEDSFVRQEAQRAVLKAVAGLPDREREVVALKFGANLTNREIATLTGLSASNVGVILYRTMKQLRVTLHNEGQVP